MKFPEKRREESREILRKLSMEDRRNPFSALHDRVAQHAELVDFDFNDVARLQKDGRLAGETHTRRRAREDQVPRLQCENLRQISQDLADREDHLPRIAVLHRLPIEPQLYGQLVRIRDFVLRDQVRSGRSKRIERLADHPLLAVLFQLPVASGDIMPDGIAGNIIQAVVGPNVSAASAHYNDQLGLVIDLLAHGGQHNGLSLPDECRGVLAEQNRFPGDGRASFPGMIGVIETETDDLARVGNRGQELDPIGRVSDDFLAPGRLGRCLECGLASLQQFPQAKRQRGIRAVQVDVAAVMVDCRPRAELRPDRGKAHETVST